MKNKKRTVRSIYLVVAVLVLVFILVKSVDMKYDLIQKEIDQTVPVEIYNGNGVKTGETTVTIKGTYCPHLFRSDSYWGEFSLPEFPETQQPGTTANIVWNKRRGYPEEPKIMIYGNVNEEYLGALHLADIGSVFININRQMDEFAWWTVKGTIATSYDAYKSYADYD